MDALRRRRSFDIEAEWLRGGVGARPRQHGGGENGESDRTVSHL
jgi:hypothetical protein